MKALITDRQLGAEIYHTNFATEPLTPHKVCLLSRTLTAVAVAATVAQTRHNGPDDRDASH